LCILDLPCFEFRAVHSKFKGILIPKYKNWSANIIESSQTAQKFRLTLLYNGCKGLPLTVVKTPVYTIVKKHPYKIVTCTGMVHNTFTMYDYNDYNSNLKFSHFRYISELKYNTLNNDFCIRCNSLIHVWILFILYKNVKAKCQYH
jgi:hypothetical protein